MSTEVYLAQKVLDAIERAKGGDPVAWGTVYAVAAAFARSGRAMPEPLASVMAQRLLEIGAVLASPREKDKRAAVHGAVAPGAKRGRPAKPVDVIGSYAEDVLRVLGEKPTAAEINEVVDFTMQFMTNYPGTTEPLYTRQSLLVEVQKLRHSRKA